MIGSRDKPAHATRGRATRRRSTLAGAALGQGIARSIACALLLAAGAAGAHPSPSGEVLLDVDATGVSAELRVPLEQWNLAAPYIDPDEGVLSDAERGAVAAYLVEHVGVVTARGARWPASVEELELRDEHGLAHLVARTRYPAPGGQVGDAFTVSFDAVIHRVRSHSASLLLRGDTRLAEPLEVPLALDTFHARHTAARVERPRSGAPHRHGDGPVHAHADPGDHVVHR